MEHAHGVATRLRDTYPHGQFVPSGKFGRLFPRLEPFLPPDEALCELGEAMRDPDPSSPEGDNPKVPAGYTYLGQFIAHDMTFDPTSLQETLIDPLALRNFRTPSLDLDSIYGAGPVGQPYLFVQKRVPARLARNLSWIDTTGTQPGDGDSSVLVRNWFLIGRTSAQPGDGDPTVPPRLPYDLPRGPNGLALIGDPRNDENLIVAQMHLAFLHFHNKVFVRLSQRDIEPMPRESLSRLLFERARELVVWHYQWIVLHDFLPLILDPIQLRIVLRGGRRFYCPQGEPFIPVEFSAAAYRFGHSMVREEYDYNRVFTFRRGDKRRASLERLFHFTGSSGNSRSVPIPSDWIIDWRRFFSVGQGAQVGFSRQINPSLALQRHDLPELLESKSLAARDLLRGKRLGLPSGQSVARVLRLSALTPEEISQSPGRDGQVAKKYGFDVETPLWYYILKEAQVRRRGQRLGPVGSRIVAEVFVGLLELDSGSYLARKPQWTPTLHPQRKPHFTMADLLAFLGERELNPIGDRENPLQP
jgi:hypothetical protein